jgi:lipoprotein-anchoring transpeptidase ErfK/SrfK
MIARGKPPKHGGSVMKHIFALSVLVLALVISIAAPPCLFAGNGGRPKIIYVITDDQKLFAWEGNELIFEFDMVSGRPGKETLPGVFHIFRKHEEYTSMTYGSEMPYSMFFTQDGKAIHATKWATLRSYLHAYIYEGVGSHGCVGLTLEDAEAIFAWAPMGTRVVVLQEETDE